MLERTSYVANIIKDLAKLIADIPMPDSTHNIGRILAQVYFWDVVRKHAARQSDQLWEVLHTEGLIAEEEFDPGEHVLCESPRFVCSVKVTNPVKRFSSEKLAGLLKKSKYKIPELITREYVERARVETKSAHTYKIEERQ